jgi:enoyl-CoA hydratase/carnithine racemase
VDTLITQEHEQVLVVRLNRPARRNALNLRLLEELGTVLQQAEASERVRALVVAGNAQAFSAGQDLKEEEPPNYVAAINAVFGRLESLPMPTIAAIDGWCIAGGLELALCCDLRVCAETAKIGDWHARINSIGGAGATVRLYPSDELMERAVTLAQSLCVGSATTVRYAKQALNAAADLGLAEALSYALQCQSAVRDAQAGSYAERFGARRADET